MPIVNMATDHEKAEATYRRNQERSVEYLVERERRQRRLDSAQTIVDAQGTQWKYVIEEDGSATILECHTQLAVLHIPDSIAGVHVAKLEPDCCRGNRTVEEALVADSIETVGACVFRDCSNLRRAVLPAMCGEFVPTWFRNCPNVEEIVLPGKVRTLKGNVFDPPKLRHLVIGAETEELLPGMFEKSALECIEVAEGNPYLKTDGTALYSADGETLVALAVPVQRYDVAPGTKRVARKALGTFPRLTDIRFPDSIEQLGEYSLSRSGIESFGPLPNLKRIADHAFYNCKNLREVSLNEGLEEIGDSAFCGTPVQELRIPASVRILGGKLADDGQLSYAGANRTFSVASDSPYFTLDEFGGLYRHDGDGIVFVHLLSAEVEEYEVLAGTRVIGERAFYRNGTIRRVVLPEGLQEIHEAAFRACDRLQEAVMPSSMLRVDRDAFLDSTITSLHIGKGLTRVGENAFVTRGAHRDGRREVTQITVEEGNERFYMLPGLLMERRKNGRSRVLMYVEGERHVEVPLEVTSIAAYAFNNARRLKELYISERITDIEIRGLAIKSCVQHLHIDLAEPVDGHDCIDLNFPQTSRAEQEINLAFSMSRFVDVESIVSHYDDAVVNTQSYDMENRTEMEIYVQAIRAIARLKDPIYLSPVNKSLYEKLFKQGLIDSCVAIARHDNRQAIDDLVELGYVNLESISKVIERVGDLQDAAMTSHLLELKHRMVGESGSSYLDDFDL